MELTPQEEKEIHWFFIVSVLLKGFNALFELAGGLALLFSGYTLSIINGLIDGELIEDPSDFVSTSLRKVLPYFSSHSQIFAGVYLLLHGIIKIVLVWGLLKKKVWAYPATMAVLGAFIVYELIKFSIGHSKVLLFLAIFDIMLLWLVWREYKKLKLHRNLKVS